MWTTLSALPLLPICAGFGTPIVIGAPLGCVIADADVRLDFIQPVLRLDEQLGEYGGQYEVLVRRVARDGFGQPHDSFGTAFANLGGGLGHRLLSD
jgi:hypothetical protein